MTTLSWSRSARNKKRLSNSSNAAWPPTCKSQGRLGTPGDREYGQCAQSISEQNAGACRCKKSMEDAKPLWWQSSGIERMVAVRQGPTGNILLVPNSVKVGSSARCVRVGG